MTPTMRKDSRPSRKVTSSDCNMSMKYTVERRACAKTLRQGRWYSGNPGTRHPLSEAAMQRQTAALKLGTLGLTLALALVAPGPARADEAAGHYTLALQYKREGKVPDAIAE